MYSRRTTECLLEHIHNISVNSAKVLETFLLEKWKQHVAVCCVVLCEEHKNAWLGNTSAVRHFSEAFI